MRYIGKACLAVLFVLISSMTITMRANSLTPEQVAQKAAAVITSAKGMSADFSVRSGGMEMKGTVKSSGTRFSVTTPQVSTWYNGKSLYTYNPKTSETTVTVPTAQELAESNPLLYVRGGGSGFTYKFSTVKRTGKYVIDLVPRDRKSWIKKMTFTINSSNFHVEKIDVISSAGSTVVTVLSFKTGMTFQASEFEYPASKYPKAEIVDLR